MGRNQNKQTFGPIKRDSYVACANRDKISRYTDIERKNKVEQAPRMRSGGVYCGPILAILSSISPLVIGVQEAHIGIVQRVIHTGFGPAPPGNLLDQEARVRVNVEIFIPFLNKNFSFLSVE